MYFGGTGGPAAAVASRASSQQDDDVAGIGGLADHIFSRSRAHDRADLHTFRHIVRMIDLFYISGGKTDLVTIGTVAAGRAPHQLLLGQFALQRLGCGHRGICGAGHTHGLIYIGAARQRIADGPAQTGGRAAERLDLRGMVVGLVLKVHQPLFHFSVDLHRHHDGAGVDLVRLLLILELTFFFQFLHGHQRQIHQARELVLPALIDLLPVSQVLLVGALDGIAVIAVSKRHIRQLRAKGGVAAVIGPVGVQHTDLRHGRIAFLLVPEIILNMQEILKRHGQVQGAVQFLQIFLGHPAESVENLHILRLLEHRLQGIRFLHIRLTGVHRVDTERLDRRQFLLGRAALDHVHGGRADHRLLGRIQKLHALYRGIRPLVKLSRQILHTEHRVPFLHRKFFQIKDVHRRLTEYRMAGFLKSLVRNMLHIIADQYSDPRHSLNSQITLDLFLQFLRLDCIRLFFLNKNASYHAAYLHSKFRAPASRRIKCRKIS